MRGISAHSNGFSTCKLIHILQTLLGSIDVPGGFRYKAPYPKHVVPGPKPAGKNIKALIFFPAGFGPGTTCLG